MEVYATQCKNCLFTEDRIVSPQRAKAVIQDCLANQTHFICHAASIEGKDICCKTFFDTLGHNSKLIAMNKWLGTVNIVPLPDTAALASYKQIQKFTHNKNEK